MRGQPSPGIRSSITPRTVSSTPHPAAIPAAVASAARASGPPSKPTAIRRSAYCGRVLNPRGDRERTREFVQQLTRVPADRHSPSAVRRLEPTTSQMAVEHRACAGRERVSSLADHRSGLTAYRAPVQPWDTPRQVGLDRQQRHLRAGRSRDRHRERGRIVALRTRIDGDSDPRKRFCALTAALASPWVCAVTIQSKRGRPADPSV